MNYLKRLESEAIYIIREALSSSDNPVMLYSVGKDSSVLLHLAKKAFYPSLPPFPLLHVDTTWKFQDMYELRSKAAKNANMELIIHQNPEGIKNKINPFDHGSVHTEIWKTDGLKQALRKHNFDMALGGARRDEEKSRAKERIFSFRDKNYIWDPKQQRPEIWSLFNTRKNTNESFRVFPLSNWTELDIWQYIYLEGIEIVPLYFAAPRPTIKRDGLIIMIDDNRFKFRQGEKSKLRSIRFRTLGCYPLSGAILSQAKSIKDVIQENIMTSFSEREGRSIDKDHNSSMEFKKQRGYF
tara:strand:- start:532 stop:1422 length:891 start_codon:yes stop_codon:yes gene_type:complete